MPSYRDGFGRIMPAPTATDAWIRFVQDSSRRLPRQVLYAINFIMRDIQDDATRLAPTSKGTDRKSRIRPGYLRDSSYTKVTMAGRYAILGETGFSAPYAADVHNTEHDYRYGQAHFLSIPFGAKASPRRLNEILRTGNASA